MEQEILNDVETKMEKTIGSLNIKLATIRTGRANPSMLDNITVEYYGAKTPLKQLAVISVPEGRQLLIKPFDKSCLAEVERSINEANLGVTPNNDGETIRIILPVPTEERRKELIKRAKGIVEEARISLRNIRHDANNKLKGSDLTEDIEKSCTKQVQDHINDYNRQVDEILKLKEKDIMEI